MEEKDQFAWITKLCEPTACSNAELHSCGMAREFEDVDSQTVGSSSLELTPTQPTGIIIVSAPESDGIGEAEKNENVEEESVANDDTEIIVDLSDDTATISNGKRKSIEEIDKFRYDGKLPRPLDKKEANSASTMDFLDIVKISVEILGNRCADDDDEDLLEIAQRKGCTFPAPSWWS